MDHFYLKNVLKKKRSIKMHNNWYYVFSPTDSSSTNVSPTDISPV